MAKISDIKNNNNSNVLPFVARKKVIPWLNIIVLVNILMTIGLYVIVMCK